MFKFRFNKNYFLLFVLLFVTEVLIALYVHDNFIRPFFGDFLVVILVYTFVMSFINAPKIAVAVGVLLFAFVVELSQYLQLIELLGLHDSKLAKTVMGNSFMWEDILMYVLGIVFTLGVEYLWFRKK